MVVELPRLKTCGANTRTSVNITEADSYDKAFWESDSVQEVAKLWNMRQQTIHLNGEISP